MSVTCECHFFLSVCFTSHRSWLEANAMFIAEERHCVITAVCVPFECTPESWTPSDTGTAGSHVYLRDKWYYATLRELHRGCPLESPHSAISHSYFMSLKPLYLYSSAGLERVLKWIPHCIQSLRAYDSTYGSQREGENEEKRLWVFLHTYCTWLILIHCPVFPLPSLLFLHGSPLVVFDSGEAGGRRGNSRWTHSNTQLCHLPWSRECIANAL